MRLAMAGTVLVSMVALADGYSYRPEGKRDPFADVTVTAPPAVVPCATTLCRLPLRTLRLVAIVSGDSTPVAMFENAEGTGFLARRNTEIGQAGGRVSEIDRDCVTVTERKNKVRLCLIQGGAQVHELSKDAVIPVP